jgi:hypothetical protein
MADLANIVEAVAATLGAGVLLARPTYSAIIKKNRARVIDDLFLHGSQAVEGVRPALMPASQRLTGVETGLILANSKLDSHDAKLDTLLATSRATSRDVKAVAGTVSDVAYEVHTNAGASMKDGTDRIEAEQVRVAEELTEYKERS